MPVITAAGRPFDVDAVVFDKDGTLVDFAALWGARTASWVERMAVDAARPEAAAPLYELLGYDPAAARFALDGPLAIGTTADLYAIAAAVLCRHGLGWHEARPMAVNAATTTMLAPPTPNEIRPADDVAGLFSRLRRAGLSITIATNDDRTATEATLAQMGVAGDVALIACGDDDFRPKPDPAGLRWLAAQLGTAPERLVVVGDSANDMLYARNAGAAGIGVLGGAGARESLEALADVVVGSIAELRVVA